MTDEQFGLFLSEVVKIREAIEQLAGHVISDTVSVTVSELSDCSAEAGESPITTLRVAVHE